MAVARDLAGKTNNVVCVIGDGAMSAGMAYEAMNNAGARNERLIVILNDNDMSIARPVGALSNYLARITSSGTYLHLRDIGQAARQAAAEVLGASARRCAEEYTRTYWTGGTLFEELGFYYVGPDRRPQSQASCCPCCRTCAMPRAGRSWSTWSPGRARATRRPRPPTTSTTASTGST